MLAASTQAIGDLVASVIHDHHLERPVIVAVGGGAGGLGRAVAGAMKLDIVVPESAEVISAIGDALSLVRAERERTFNQPTPAELQALVAEVEAEAILAGASASTLDVRVEQVVERGAVRVTVTGAVGLNSGAVPGRQPATRAEVSALATARQYADVAPLGQYWFATRLDHGGNVAVFDLYGDLVIDVAGETVDASARHAGRHRGRDRTADEARRTGFDRPRRVGHRRRPLPAGRRHRSARGAGNRGDAHRRRLRRNDHHRENLTHGPVRPRRSPAPSHRHLHGRGARRSAWSLGVLVGRVTAPTVDDRLASVRKSAQQTAAGLRVIAIHDESDTVSNQTANSGADLVLKQTRSELKREFDDAPWITLAQREALLKSLDELEAQPDRKSDAFGKAADALATQIEETFGAAPQ